MNEAQIDIQQLRIKHILYKSKVRSVAFGGQFDQHFFSSTGPVSEWFYTVGNKKYANLAEIQQLQRVNNLLTSSAGKVFSLYNSGQIDEAHESLKEIETLSEQFQKLLDQLEKRFK